VSGKASRSKGARGESAARRLLEERGYELHHNRDAGHDFLVLDKNGKAISVEIKNTASLLHAAYDQCKENAHGKPRMLLWHASGWGMGGKTWLCFKWPEGSVHVWKAN
jgi:Holliday junction resolvase-like predicted endonuclease